MNQLTLLGLGNELSAADVIERVFRHHAGPACLTCSFQLEDMVVLHLLRQHQADISVLFLDTGYHFAETYAYRDRMSREWNINLINIRPEQSVVDQESQFGILYRTDPGKCCHLRKVEPLFHALESFEIWFTGLRREQSPTRKGLSGPGSRWRNMRQSMAFQLCLYMRPATAASVASHVLQFLLRALILVPADGAEPNWNAVSTPRIEISNGMDCRFSYCRNSWIDRDWWRQFQRTNPRACRNAHRGDFAPR